MKKNEKNEELQSRREFFKKAAKGALPILAVMALDGAPAIVNAVTKQSSYCVAGAACTGLCSGSCKGTCKFGCSGCSGSCKGTCRFSSSR